MSKSRTRWHICLSGIGCWDGVLHNKTQLGQVREHRAHCSGCRLSWRWVQGRRCIVYWAWDEQCSSAGVLCVQALCGMVHVQCPIRWSMCSVPSVSRRPWGRRYPFYLGEYGGVEAQRCVKLILETNRSLKQSLLSHYRIKLQNNQVIGQASTK